VIRDGAGDGRPAWWQRGVVHQVYPRSFQDASGDGVGDLPGITQRLDYLAWLGVHAIWISPFYPSPMADFGYDVSDYTDVDPLFGTLADFDALLAAAHARNIRVIIDFVPNHTSDQHPWFQEARASRESPKRDWYVFRDPKPDGSPPNNWVAAFGGSAWTFDEATGQYYLHSFLPQQPDVNWRNPELKAAMFDVLRFWLESGVDGFRFDVASSVMKDPELRDNPPNLEGGGHAHKEMGDYSAQLHIHDRMHPDIHALYREIRALLDAYSEDGQPRYMIGETHIFDPEEWATLYGAELDQMHQPGNFGLLKLQWAAEELRAHVDGIERAVPPGAWPNYVLSNHDEHRVATRVGPDQARNALMLLLTLRGTPTVYYGEELGLENVPVPPELEQDPWGLRVPGPGLGRDPERTQMPWDASENGGFCPPGVRPWLPLNPDYRTRNVAVQREDPTSMLSLARRLLQLREERPALAIGAYRALDGVSADCFAYLRAHGDERLLVALNLSGAPLTLQLSEGGRGELLLSTTMTRSGSVSLGDLALAAHEGAVVAL
jgi:glycosidase